MQVCNWNRNDLIIELLKNDNKNKEKRRRFFLQTHIGEKRTLGGWEVCIFKLKPDAIFVCFWISSSGMFSFRHRKLIVSMEIFTR